MDYLENVKRAVSDAAQTVSKVSGETVDKVKTKYSIYDMSGDVKKLLEEIGFEVYKAYTDGEDTLSEVVIEKCREIDEKNAKIEEAESKLGSGKAEAQTCPNCGAKAANDAVFCAKCGGRIDGSDGGVTVTVTED